jgi:hypothetical protein
MDADVAKISGMVPALGYHLIEEGSSESLGKLK